MNSSKIHTIQCDQSPSFVGSMKQTYLASQTPLRIWQFVVTWPFGVTCTRPDVSPGRAAWKLRARCALGPQSWHVVFNRPYSSGWLQSHRIEPSDSNTHSSPTVLGASHRPPARVLGGFIKSNSSASAGERTSGPLNRPTRTRLPRSSSRPGSGFMMYPFGRNSNLPPPQVCVTKRVSRPIAPLSLTDQNGLPVGDSCQTPRRPALKRSPCLIPRAGE